MHQFELNILKFYLKISISNDIRHIMFDKHLIINNIDLLFVLA